MKRHRFAVLPPSLISPNATVALMKIFLGHCSGELIKEALIFETPTNGLTITPLVSADCCSNGVNLVLTRKVRHRV